jgi:MFS family permease
VLVALVVALYFPVEGVVLPVHFTSQGAPERLGSLLMAMSGGIVLGTLSYERLARWCSRRLLFVCAMLGAALSLVWMAFLPGFAQLLVAGALSGVFWGPVGPLLNHAMQLRTPHHLRGRVAGTVNSASMAAGPAGFLAVGFLVEAVGARPAFLGLAVALLVVMVAMMPRRAWKLLDAEPVAGSAASDHHPAAKE